MGDGLPHLPPKTDLQPSSPSGTAPPCRPHGVTSGARSLSLWGTHAARSHGSGWPPSTARFHGRWSPTTSLTFLQVLSSLCPGEDMLT